ncbi:MAG: hypothetical protein IPQ15_00015 [Betaproteobacteria bacterium]|nr:hypothetical protein [Betaproteobacteria bacterium]
MLVRQHLEDQLCWRVNRMSLPRQLLTSEERRQRPFIEVIGRAIAAAPCCFVSCDTPEPPGVSFSVKTAHHAASRTTDAFNLSTWRGPRSRTSLALAAGIIRAGRDDARFSFSGTGDTPSERGGEFHRQ